MLDSKPMTIRPETSADYAQVHDVNVQAFETDAEAKLIEALRSVAKPIVSLVACMETKIVGHILFTPVTLETNPKSLVTMGLGPMAVTPGHQGNCAGSQLVRQGLEECRTIGTDAVVVLGHKEFYPRLGFVPARPFGIYYKGEEFDPHFMALELRANALTSLSGEVHYHREFDAV